jgi:hypothetical protein
MAIKYSSVPDSLFTITEGNGIEFKDLDYSAWQSTVESQAGQWAVLMSDGN